MKEIAWILVKNLFIFPVLGTLCASAFMYGSFYNSKFHKILSVLGIIAVCVLIKVLNFGI